jgi:hypothetical protein
MSLDVVDCGKRGCCFVKLMLLVDEGFDAVGDPWFSDVV